MFFLSYFSSTENPNSYCPWPPCYSGMNITWEQLFNETFSEKYHKLTKNNREEGTLSLIEKDLSKFCPSASQVLRIEDDNICK